MTDIISIANQKGGVLKTTLTIHLALHLAIIEKKRVLVVDMDPQASLSNFMRNRHEDDCRELCELPQLISGRLDPLPEPPEEINPPRLFYASGDGRLKRTEEHSLRDVIAAMSVLQKLKGFEYILLDHSPTASNRLHAGLAISNWVIMPSTFDQFSEDGVMAMYESLTMLKERAEIHELLEHGVRVKPLCIVPTMIHGGNTEQMERVAVAYQSDLGSLIIETPIKVRPTIQEAIENNKTVWDLPKNQARESREAMAVCMLKIQERLDQAKAHDKSTAASEEHRITE